MDLTGLTGNGQQVLLDQDNKKCYLSSLRRKISFIVSSRPKVSIAFALSLLLTSLNPKRSTAFPEHFYCIMHTCSNSIMAYHHPHMT